MKKIRFVVAALLAALLQVVPVSAQDESVVTLAGNAFVVGGPKQKTYIDEQHSAIRNWTDKETVISFYFRAMESGNMTIALQAVGQSRIEASICRLQNIKQLQCPIIVLLLIVAHCNIIFIFIISAFEHSIMTAT